MLSVVVRPVTQRPWICMGQLAIAAPTVTETYSKAQPFYRAIFGLILGHLRTASVIIWERNGEANGRFYWLSSWRSASLVSPETVPVNSPVEAKKTGLFVASANTGTTVSVNERTPDAFLKRPVPPVI
jgi:hypothetical protein